MLRVTLLSFVAACLLAAAAPTQVRLGEFGFEVQGRAGVAGDSCWGFDCRPRRLAIVGGEQLTVQVRAPHGAPLWIFASSAAPGSCVQLPGLYNQLVLNPPLWPVVVATVDRPNTQRFCYDGIWRSTWTVPTGLPSGASLALQSVAAVGTPTAPNAGFALSSAILLVAR